VSAGISHGHRQPRARSRAPRESRAVSSEAVSNDHRDGGDSVSGNDQAATSLLHAPDSPVAYYFPCVTIKVSSSQVSFPEPERRSSILLSGLETVVGACSGHQLCAVANRLVRFRFRCNLVMFRLREALIVRARR
jgi:hypothetical protein